MVQEYEMRARIYNSAIKWCKSGEKVKVPASDHQLIALHSIPLCPGEHRSACIAMHLGQHDVYPSHFAPGSCCRERGCSRQSQVRSLIGQWHGQSCITRCAARCGCGTNSSHNLIHQAAATHVIQAKWAPSCIRNDLIGEHYSCSCCLADEQRAPGDLYQLIN